MAQAYAHVNGVRPENPTATEETVQYADYRTWLTKPGLQRSSIFRASDTAWAQHKAEYKHIGGNPYDLEKAVDDFLRKRKASETTGTRQSLSTSLVSSKDFLELDITERHYHMDWLKERSTVILYGPRGVGKTMCQLGLAIALATGKPFRDRLRSICFLRHGG